MKGGRRRRSSSRPRRSRRGRGKAWDWIKGAAGKVSNFLKKTKVLSSIAPAVLGAIPGAGGVAGNLAKSAITQLGYGRRRRGRKGKIPPGLAAYMAKKQAGGRRRSRSRSRSRRGRGMPVSLGVAAMNTYPYQTSFARVRV
jgi:hypothetical protein